MNPASSFEDAFQWILEAEGPDTNDPDDPGGLTRFGIAQKRHPEVDVATLTEEDAKRIYREQYWDQIHGDELPPVLALVVFDGAVVQGVGRSIFCLQEALGVETDGLVGPKTVAAAFEQGLGVLTKFLSLRAHAYMDLVIRKPVMLKYLKGWIGRLIRVRQRALRLWGDSQTSHFYQEACTCADTGTVVDSQNPSIDPDL